MNYSEMEPVVEAICQSLEKEPEKWLINVFDIKHKSKFNQIEFVLKDPAFVYRGSGATTERIFSNEQGKRIEASIKKMREKSLNETQKKLLNSL